MRGACQVAFCVQLSFAVSLSVFEASQGLQISFVRRTGCRRPWYDGTCTIDLSSAGKARGNITGWDIELVLSQRPEEC